MSAWAAAFWIWIALGVGAVFGWMLRTALPSDDTHTRQEHQNHE